MKVLLAFPVGIPVTFLGLILIAGSVESAVQIVLVSIICTAGVGLLFWIPLCWAVGGVTVALATLVMKLYEGRYEASPEHPLQNRNEHALTAYIRRMQDRGRSDDEIVAHLLKSGWSVSEVEKARRMLHS
jgi:hypothetical protein